MSVNKRIKLILEEKRYTNSAFEKKNNLANGTIRKISLEENFNPSYKVINAFATSFPDLDIRWLVTGEGSMYYKSNMAIENTKPLDHVELNKLDGKLGQMHKDLESTSNATRSNKNKIRELERELEKAIDRLNSMTDKKP